MFSTVWGGTILSLDTQPAVDVPTADVSAADVPAEEERTARSNVNDDLDTPRTTSRKKRKKLNRLSSVGVRRERTKV